MVFVLTLLPTHATFRSAAETIEIDGGVRVHHLIPRFEETHPVPVILVHSLLSKWYVFDLHPNRSLAAYLRDNGFDVWCVDWGEPEGTRPTPSFSAYVQDWMDSVVDEVNAATGVDRVTFLGYSLGGVLSTMYAALAPDRVHNLITLTTPVDFSETGINVLYARMFPAETMVDFWGNIPAWWLRNATIWGTMARARGLWKSFGNELSTPVGRSVVGEVMRWTFDNVPLAGEMFRRLMRDCYRQNLLIEDRFTIGGEIVKLSRISAPLLTISAADDDLCPRAAAEALNHAVSSEDETAIMVPGSHLGAVIGQEAHHLLWTRIVDWLSKRSGHHPGSWYGIDDVI